METRQSDEHAVRQIVEEMRQGWNHGDGEAWAAGFAEDADAISWNGKHVTSRAQNAEVHAWLFANLYRDTTNHLQVNSIRWLGDDVAVLLCETYLTDAKGERLGSKTLPLMVMHKSQGIWQIVTFQNTAVSE